MPCDSNGRLPSAPVDLFEKLGNSLLLPCATASERAEVEEKGRGGKGSICFHPFLLGCYQFAGEGMITRLR